MLIAGWWRFQDEGVKKGKKSRLVDATRKKEGGGVCGCKSVYECV